MPKLTLNCPICDKPLIRTGEITILSERLYTYKCGHAFAQSFDAPKALDFTGANPHKHARPYQAEGVDFIVNGHERNPGGWNCIIGDKMRLGKTPQALLALKNSPERQPCLILVRSANLWQWIAEFREFTSTLPLGIWPITSSKTMIPPGFSAYIMSMDLLANEGTCKACNASMRLHTESVQYPDGYCKKTDCSKPTPSGDSMVERLLAFGFKSLILDEAHSVKNQSSARSQALIRFLHQISKSEEKKTLKFNCAICNHSWEETILIQTDIHKNHVSHRTNCPECHTDVAQFFVSERIETSRKCGVVMLTGTAIKNRADEYFIPLNIVAPDKFPSVESFRRKWLEMDKNGRYRVKSHLVEFFRAEIEPYVLRREWEDVYAQLPPLNRPTTIITIEDENLKKLYNATLDTLEEQMESKARFNFFDSIGELTRLRQICGLAKCGWITNYIDTCLDEDPSSRWVIGLHHKAVRDQLAYGLSKYGVLSLSGEDSPEQKFHIMKAFQSSPQRVCLMNMLAGGVGLDMYYVENALIAERQWSSADEEQFEARFFNPDMEMVHQRLNTLRDSMLADKDLRYHEPYNEIPRIYSKDQPKVTNIEYIIAKGTIDEFFDNMVTQKREIFGETISNDWDLTKNADSFRDLMEKTVAGRL